MNTAQLNDVQDIRDYMFGGKAEFTLHSLKTDNHFTYKIIYHSPDPERLPKKPWLFYLSGNDNVSDWEYGFKFEYSKITGVIGISMTRKSPDITSNSMIAIRWFVWMLNKGVVSDDLEFMHSGKCSACGRKLTTPESIRTGMGPVCRSRL